MPEETAAPFRVLFVCTGNICRSPMAEVVFRERVREAGLGDRVIVDSAGFDGYHEGDPPDRRALAALRSRGYDGSELRARLVDEGDLDRSDLVVALDRGHEQSLRRLASDDRQRSRIRLLRSFEDAGLDGPALDVADPYYSDQSVFDETLDEIERAAEALLADPELADRLAGRGAADRDGVS